MPSARASAISAIARGDAAVSVFERMDGHKPQMSDAGPDDGIDGCRALKPCEKSRHLLFQPFGGGGFEVNGLPTDRAGDNLHRSAIGTTPRTDHDAPHAAATGWEQGGVPIKEPFLRKRFLMVLRRFEHHFHDAFDITTGGDKPGNIQPKATGNRRAHLLGIEILSLDSG